MDCHTRDHGAILTVTLRAFGGASKGIWTKILPLLQIFIVGAPIRNQKGGPFKSEKQV